MNWFRKYRGMNCPLIEEDRKAWEEFRGQQLAYQNELENKLSKLSRDVDDLQVEVENSGLFGTFNNRLSIPLSLNQHSFVRLFIQEQLKTMHSTYGVVFVPSTYSNENLDGYAIVKRTGSGGSLQGWSFVTNTQFWSKEAAQLNAMRLIMGV